MLHRKEAGGIVAISQPAHAWVSGQLARSWGEHPFQRPSEEACLAAEQHDIGFLEWEQNPTLNPSSGLPYTFMEMPKPLHLEIWTRGIQKMLRFGRYPALLVSFHFAGLAKRNQAHGGPEEQRLATQFLKEQQGLQKALMASLEKDGCYAPLLEEGVMKRECKLVSIWDWMSLLLCHGLREETKVPGVPAGRRAVEIRMTPLHESGQLVSLEPWPFPEEQVRLVCEGRRLPHAYKDEPAMRAALRAAEPVTLVWELEPEGAP